MIADRYVLTTNTAEEEPRPGCGCARCHCLRLQEENGRQPMTMAEAWLIRRSWPQDHQDFWPRDAFLATFGFAIITGAAVEAIGQLGPILEVGAGNGYLAMELQKAGTDVVTTDPNPEIYFSSRHRWARVERISGLEALEKHPGRNLLICWPSREGWATGVLRHFQGGHVAYIGEPRSGCTGTESMFDALTAYYRRVQSLEIARFRNVNDRLEVWERR